MDFQVSAIVTLLIKLSITTPMAANSYILKEVFNAEQAINKLEVLNGTLYFTGGENLYSYSPKTGEGNKIGKIPGSSMKFSHSTTSNGKMYITDYQYGLYEFDPVLGLKLATSTDDCCTQAVTALNDKVYFGTSKGNLFEFDPESQMTKTLTMSNTPNLKLGDITGIAASRARNKIYTGSWHAEGIHEIDPETQNVQLISSEECCIRSIVEVNDKLYFGSWPKELREFDPIKRTTNTLCEFPSYIETNDIAVLNKNLYVGGVDSNFLWKLNEKSECERIPVSIPDYGNNFALVTLNNKLYIGSNNSRLYEFYETESEERTEEEKDKKAKTEQQIEKVLTVTNSIDLGDAIKVQNLNVISNNKIKVILNEISYLNPEIDILYLDIVARTNRSAAIKGKEIYSGQINVYFTIVDNDSTESFDFLELLRKSVIFTHRNSSKTFNATEMKISTNNLIYSNVYATKIDKSGQQLYSTRQNICFDSVIIKNNQNQNVQARTPVCNYQKEIRIDTAILKGLKGDKLKDSRKGWKNFIGVWPFENINLKICAQNYVRPNDRTIRLSDVWDAAIELNPCRIISGIALDSQTINIPPNRAINVTATQEILVQEITLNLKQVIYGEVIVSFSSDGAKFKYSVKELMENLKQEEMLPPQFWINEDETTTFSGQMVRTLTKASTAVIEITETDLD